MNSADGYIVAFDLGTSALKLALVTTMGEVVGSAVEEYPLYLLGDGGVEQDPEDWWRAVVRGTRRLLAVADVDPGRVVGVGCSSQWSGTVAVGSDGRPLMRALIWMDSRGAEQLRQVTGGLPSVQGYGLRKLVTWIRRSGGAPGHAGKDSLAHILYLRDQLPAVYQRTHRFLEPRDWINLRLTGRFATSFDAVALLWVANTRAVDAVRYDDRLLRIAGLERDKLPELVPAATVLGTLRPQVAAELGLPASARVVTGAPDIMASAIPGRYLLANEQESAGVCLAELRRNVLFAQDGAAPAAAPEDPYAAMFALAEAVPAGSDGLIFTPWVNGERTPVDDRTVRGGFFNQSLGVTRGHLVRAVLEGVAYNSRWLLVHVERFIKRRLETITAVGGGARSELWCQIHADVLDRVVLPRGRCTTATTTTSRS